MRPGGRRARSVGDDLRAALPGWVVARVIVAGALIVAHVVDEQYGPRVGRHVIHTYAHQGLSAWDGQWYLRIAEHGYRASPANALRFFPLYPLAGRALAVVLGGRHLAALLIIANLASLAAAALVHRIAVFETGDADLARRAAWLMALLPPSFVLVMAYSEGLFILLSAGMVLALRQRRFWLAAALGLGCGLARPTGVLLAVPAAIEATRDLRSGRRLGPTPRSETVGQVAAVAAAPAGCALFLLWVRHVFGDALLPLHLQQRPIFRGKTANPVLVLIRAVRDGASQHWGGNAAHLATAALLIGLAVVAWRRWPAAYSGLALATLLVTLSGTRIGSLERYGLLTFPFVLALAGITGSPRAERSAFALGAASLLAYAAMAFVGLAVP